jgi:hypothetical protein
MSSYIHFPSVPAARADPAPTPASCLIAPGNTVGCVPWVPAGPALNTFLSTAYNGAVDEYQTGLLGNQIDLMDETLTPSEINAVCPQPTTGSSGFYCTTPIGEHGYFELQIDLANTGQASVADSWWGIPMDFGNSVKGLEIRQAIAHLVDRGSFTANEPHVAAKSTPLDEPMPSCTAASCTNGGAVNPISCTWDTIAANTAGAPSQIAATGGNPSCAGAAGAVGASGATAYNIQSAAGTTCGRDAWSPCPGSPDFCAAAFHFVRAGIATGFDPTTCELSSATTTNFLNASAVASSAIPNFFIRSDSAARHALGDALASEICSVFSGVYGACSQLATTPGPFSAFCGFATSTTGTPTHCWGMYTAAFINVFPFDSSLYFEYNSLFATATTGSPCQGTAFTASPGNYMYVCNPGYDAVSNTMEFAPALNLAAANCVSPTGQDPTIPQTTVTLGSCNNTSGVSVLDGVSAAYQAEEFYGSHEFTIPVWQNIDTFAYKTNFPPNSPTFVNTDSANVENQIGGVATGLPQPANWLNAWCPPGSCSVTNTIRQGFAQPTVHMSPYQFSDFWSGLILGNIYDSLSSTNPEIQGIQLFDWMTDSSHFTTTLGYTPSCIHLFPTESVATCLPTVGAFRNTLRSDNVWQDGTPVTAFDVRFSYLALNQTGSFQASGLSPLNDVHVLSKFQFDLVVHSIGPFTQFFLNGPTVLPGRYWSACGVLGSNTWDSDVASGSVPDACMEPASGTTGAHYDPMTQANPATGGTGIVIGSSGWTCQSSTGVLGGGCSSTGTSDTPIGGTWTLTRNGCTASSTGTTCAAVGGSQYFRSSGTYAKYLWTGMTGTSSDGSTLSRFLSCFGKAVGTTGCGNFQEGIGNPSTTTKTCPCVVGATQLSTLLRFFAVNWLPVTGTSGVGTPSTYVGIATLPPVLYEGSTTLSPGRLAGCSSTTLAAYPNGAGYDC